MIALMLVVELYSFVIVARFEDLKMLVNFGLLVDGPQVVMYHKFM